MRRFTQADWAIIALALEYYETADRVGTLRETPPLPARAIIALALEYYETADRLGEFGLTDEEFNAENEAIHAAWQKVSARQDPVT